VLPFGRDATPHGEGGRLCLAAVNTVLWRRSGEPIDRLGGYPDLLRYVARAGWLDRFGPDLETTAVQHPRRAEAAFRRAVELREALFRLFSAVAAGGEPAAADLAALNGPLAAGLGRLAILPHALPGNRYAASWPGGGAELDLPAWQVAVSAGDLLTGTELDRVKQCPGDRCGWLFYDESRNRSRRWCDSRECGNRERVRAHYHRRHPANARAADQLAAE
jgi:predicted RNA-binding Zn ribbon-like protein